MSSSHPITRLVARYGPSHGMYLYGEYCLLEALGFEAFRRRHTDAQLAALAAQLAPLSLWPAADASGLAAGADRAAGELEGVMMTLTRPPLRLGMGADLFRACLAWAGSQGDSQADPGAWFEASRAQLMARLGFMPPSLRVQLESGLPMHGYRLYIWGEAVGEGEAFPGQDLMRGPDDGAAPVVPYPWTRDPAGSGWVTWLPIGPAATPPPELERLHWIAAMNRHVTAMVPLHAQRLVTVPLVHMLLEQAEAAGYDHELERYVSVPELRLIFQDLLRQGLRLEPVPMLEAMLMAVLGDLGGRDLPPNELERLARQLPVFGTTRLVGVVRRAMGLSEQPAPPMAWPGPPPPHKPSLPVVPPAIADRWRDLAARAHAARPDAAAWVDLMRAMVPLTWQRSGYGLRWSLHVPRDAKRIVVPDDLAARVKASGRLANIQKLVERHLELAERLDELVTWLLDPAGHTLSAPTAAMAASPSWVDYEWLLAAPGRLLDEHGLRAWASSRATAGLEVEREGI